ncbi:MAG: flagellar biosynthesis protein FlhB [bacterium]
MANGEEKTEQATQKRRQDARKKGQVCKSTELSSALDFLAFAILVPAMSMTLSSSFCQTMTEGLRNIADTSFTPNDIIRHIYTSALPAIKGWLPLIGFTALVGVASNLLQVGFLFSLQPIKPDLSRIDPLKGFQRLFSTRAVADMLKAIFKTLIIGGIAWQTLQSEWLSIIQTGLMPATHGFAVVGHVLYLIALRVGFLWLVLASADYFYQRWMYEKNMRMTKDEVRREMKEQEASPFVKGKLKQRQRQLSRNRMIQDVRKADVIVTNPITYAVALRYDSSSMRSPKVLAKGRLKVAQRIREEALRHNVPIIPNPPLARELYASVEIGEEVPTTLFQAVAELLAYVYTLRNTKRKA